MNVLSGQCKTFAGGKNNNITKRRSKKKNCASTLNIALNNLDYKYLKI